MSKIKNTEKDIPTFRIVVLGNSDCGKTSIIKRFIFGKYETKTISTIGYCSYTKEICLKNCSSIELNVIEVAGQENFLHLSTPYVKKSDGALLVFSHRDKKSFDDLIKWLNYLKTNLPNFDFNAEYPMYPIYLVGNNCEEDSVIDKKEIEEFKTKNNLCGYIDTSAKEDKNINELFLNMGEIFLQIYEKSKKGTNEKLAAKSKEKKKNCILI